jgi:quinol-cytochrome oxidoreductase complex cytochrome b subunit
MTTKNHNLSFSNNVPTGLTKFSLLSLNSIKMLLPLNLPRINKNYLYALVASHIVYYPGSIFLTYAWSFGSLAGICLIIRIIFDIFLSMYYTADINVAFSSIEFST